MYPKVYIKQKQISSTCSSTDYCTEPDAIIFIDRILNYIMSLV